MSGKSTATSSISIGWPYFSRTPPPPRMPVPMPEWPVWKIAGQLVFVDHFIDRIGHPVRRVGVLHDPVELEALDPMILDQIARFPRAQLALVRVDAGKGDADVIVLGGEFGDFVVARSAWPRSRSRNRP